MAGVETYQLGDWKLQSGESIPDAQLAYKTFGDPKSPAVIYPSWYSGDIAANEWLIGEDHVLKPSKYFIIVTALFGNGESTSPSNSNTKPFPKVTFFDNVRAQHKLVTEHFGLKHARAVLGWSMGAGQTYQWATSYPDFMDIAVPFCGSAKTSLHNQVFLEGAKAALLGGKQCSSAGVSADGTVPKGEKYRAWTAEEREISLKAIARVPEDSEIEVENMKPGIGKMEAFPSIWGHWAGGPGDSKEDVAWLDKKLAEVGL